MGNPFRVAKIFQSCLPWAKPSAPGLSTQVIGSSCHLALNTIVRSREQYEYVVYSDLDERVLPTRPNIRFVHYLCDFYHDSYFQLGGVDKRGG